jgi:flagellin-like hook-associated protein FlgL
MVVQHNMQAMNANRMLNVTTSAQSKSTEKLSSGYRINRAADDAAGLSISEKMRKQINGLDQASSNAEDGVSAVQTAEGALTEVHSMLQRMNELATQAANGTNSESDRQSIQDEIDQLTTEIDRVSETTKFNEIYLLKGSTAGTSSDVKVAAHDAGLAGTLTDKGNGTTTFALDNALENGDKVTIAGKEYTIGTSGKGTVLDSSTLNTSIDGYKKSNDAAFSATLSTGDSVSYDGNTYTLTDAIALKDITFAGGDTFKVGDITFTVTAATDAGTIDSTAGTGTVGAAQAADYISKALADGKQVSVTSASTMLMPAGGGTAASAKITSGRVVESLAAGEVSSVQCADTKATTVAAQGSGAATKVTLKAGDSVTASGVKTTATEVDPEAAKTVYNGIKAMTADGSKTVKIGNNSTDAKTYTLVSDDAEDPEHNKLSADTILSMIHDGDYVSYGDTAKNVTVIGDIGGDASNEDVISAKTAYSMMAEELQKASSIGTDVAATVSNDGDGKFTITQGTVSVKDSLSFNLHVGADADMTNKITVDIDSMSAAGLGVKGLNVADDTGVAATYAIDAIADAVSKVSAQRSALGAVQNRLEHTINNLDNVVENTTSAESRIRDTDMAEEMVEYSKNNILAQAGQSMLAQANQSNQGVLSLLG